MKRSRSIAALAAAVMAISMASAMPSYADDVKYEFEDGTLDGATVQTSGSERYQKGASGDSFVFLENAEETATVKVNVKETGMYAVTLHYASPYGDKIHNFLVNGVDQGQISCPETAENEWADVSLGSVKLNAGDNELTIKSSWGWTHLDYLTVSTAELPNIAASQTNTCDPDAIPEAKKVMAYMASIYGEHILSGQQEIYANGPHGYDTEFDYIEELTGKLPAIRGFDYGNFCCPAYGSDDGTTDRITAWAAKGGLVTACFHLNVPNDFASYTVGDRVDWSNTTYSEETDFSPSKAYTEGTKENAYYTQSLDTLAAEFLKLQEKGIPVIWRPLHEAEGNGGEEGSWFWWGREGSKVYRQLWIYTYEYLTQTKGVHNLIWEWNSYNYGTSADWYPGDAYVDIIGYDKYNCTIYVDDGTGNWVPKLEHNDSAISSTFYGIMNRFNSTKMIALAECDNVPTLENLTSEKAGWLYFCPWYDGGSDNINFVSNPIFNEPEDLKELYLSEYCITLDELPKFSDIEIDPDATNPVENTEPTEPEEGHGKVSYDSENAIYSITLPKASDVFYLNVELSEEATVGANGCVATTFEKDGKYYWAMVEWKANKSGEVEVDIDRDFFKMTLNVDGEDIDITDEALIEEAKSFLKTQKSFQGQVWWVGADGDKSLATTNAEITDAYVKDAGEQDPTEPTTDEIPTDGTTDPSTNLEVTVYGDVDEDGDVGIMDVILLNRNLMIGAEVSEQGMVNADVDSNGNVDAVDSLNILKAVVKLITLPIE